MGELVAVPVAGDEVTGPGEGMEIHIYSIDGKNAKMIESYENPALKASMTRGIYMLRIIIPNSLNAAAIGIAMPLLPLWFELKYHIGAGYVGDIYTISYAATALGSFISGRYLNGHFDGLKIASLARILQGLLFAVIAFVPFLYITAGIYIIRMAVAVSSDNFVTLCNSSG